ncbi:MAG: hypothetical protein ACI4VF_01475, partial [Lachnospirales bacterium]
MNNQRKRLLSMVLAIAMMITSLNVPTFANGFSFGNNEVISGSAISVSGISTNPITDEAVFAPDYDADVSSYGTPALVTGFYQMNDIAFVGSEERPGSIDTGWYSYDDGESFEYAARTLGPSSDLGGIITFATEGAAKVKIYAYPTGGGRSIGIMNGVPTGEVTEDDMFTHTPDDVPNYNVYDFNIKNAGQYSIVTTDGYDISKVVVTPLEENEVMLTAGVDAGSVATASAESTVSDCVDFSGLTPDEKGTYTLTFGNDKKSSVYTKDVNPDNERNFVLIAGTGGKAEFESEDINLKVASGGNQYDSYCAFKLDGAYSVVINSTSDTALVLYNSSNELVNKETDGTYSLSADTEYRIAPNAVNSGKKLTSMAFTPAESSTVTLPLTVSGVGTASDVTITPAVTDNVYTVGTKYTVESDNYDISSVALSPEGTGTVDGTSFTPAAGNTGITVTLTERATASDVDLTVTGEVTVVNEDGTSLATSGKVTQGKTYKVVANSGYTLDSYEVTGATKDDEDTTKFTVDSNATAVTVTATTIADTPSESVTFVATLDASTVTSAPGDGTIVNKYFKFNKGGSDKLEASLANSLSEKLSLKDGSATITATKAIQMGSSNTDVTNRYISFKTASTITGNKVYVYALGKDNNARSLYSTAKPTSSSLNASNSVDSVDEVELTVEAGKEYAIGFNGNSYLFYIGSTAELVSWEAEPSVEETTDFSVNLSVGDGVTADDLATIAIKAILSTDENNTVEGTLSGTVIKLAGLVVGSAYKLTASTALTDLVLDWTEKSITAGTDTSATLNVTKQTATMETADVSATDNDDGSYTFNFSGYAGKYAPTTASEDKKRVYATILDDNNNVKYTENGAVITKAQSSTSNAQILYMPLYEAISGDSGKVITITGSLSTSAKLDGPLVKLAVGDFNATGNGISIRNTANGIILRVESGTSSTVTDSDVVLDHEINTSYDYSLVVDLVQKNAKLTIGDKTSDPVSISGLVDSSTSFTRLQSNTPSKDAITTSLGDITYTVTTPAVTTVVQKYTATGLLDGQKITLTNTSDNTKTYDIDANVTTETTKEIEQGEYTVTVSSVDGYTSSVTPTSFTASADNAVNFVVTNTSTTQYAEMGTYTFTKTSGGTQNVLVNGSTGSFTGTAGNISFKLYNVDSNNKVSMRESSEISFELEKQTKIEFDITSQSLIIKDESGNTFKTIDTNNKSATLPAGKYTIVGGS